MYLLQGSEQATGHNKELALPWRCLPSPRKKGKWKVNVLVAQLCLNLCNPMNCSPPVSSVHEILQARIPEWVPNFPDPGIETQSPTLQADPLPSETQEKHLAK